MVNHIDEMLREVMETVSPSPTTRAFVPGTKITRAIYDSYGKIGINFAELNEKLSDKDLFWKDIGGLDQGPYTSNWNKTLGSVYEKVGGMPELAKVQWWIWYKKEYPKGNPDLIIDVDAEGDTNMNDVETPPGGNPPPPPGGCPPPAAGGPVATPTDTKPCKTNFIIPQLPAGASGDCYIECNKKEEEKMARCDDFRKRVELMMETEGCPSTVTRKVTKRPYSMCNGNGNQQDTYWGGGNPQQPQQGQYDCCYCCK